MLNGSSGLGQAVLNGGTVQGGAATSSGLVLSLNGGTLSGVTYDGTLDLSSACECVHLADSTVVNNAAGNGPGTINDNCGILAFDNTQTFNNATINLGNASSYSYLGENDTTGAGTVLTLGSGVAIDESGVAYICTGDNSGDGIVNQGAINAVGNQRLSLHLRQWIPHQQRHDHGRFERRRADHRHHHVHQQRHDRRRQRRHGHHRVDDLHQPPRAYAHRRDV